MSTTRFKVFHGVTQCRSATPRTGTSSVIITTGSVDSERDRMMPDQLQFRVPLRVLVNHDHRSLPVGQVDTHADITRSGDKTIAAFRWLEGDDRADQVRNAFNQDMLSASVGVAVDSAVPNPFGGFDMGGTVVEFSLTPVPANAECIALLKSLFGSGRPGPPSRPRATRARGGDEVILTIIDSDDDLVSVSDGVFRAAFAEVIGREVQRQLNLLTGRVD